MEEKWAPFIGSYMKSMVVKAEKVIVQITTIKLTKENYLHRAAAITMGIVGKGNIEYTNGKKKQPNVNEHSSTRLRL